MHPPALKWFPVRSTGVASAPHSTDPGGCSRAGIEEFPAEGHDQGRASQRDGLLRPKLGRCGGSFGTSSNPGDKAFMGPPAGNQKLLFDPRISLGDWQEDFSP